MPDYLIVPAQVLGQASGGDEPLSSLFGEIGLAAVASAPKLKLNTLDPDVAKAVERGAAALFLAGYGPGLTRFPRSVRASRSGGRRKARKERQSRRLRCDRRLPRKPAAGEECRARPAWDLRVDLAGNDDETSAVGAQAEGHEYGRHRFVAQRKDRAPHAVLSLDRGRGSESEAQADAAVHCRSDLAKRRTDDEGVNHQNVVEAVADARAVFAPGGVWERAGGDRAKSVDVDRSSGPGAESVGYRAAEIHLDVVIEQTGVLRPEARHIERIEAVGDCGWVWIDGARHLRVAARLHPVPAEIAIDRRLVHF